MKNSLLDFSTLVLAIPMSFITSDLKLCSLKGADYVSVPTLAEAIGIPGNNLYSMAVGNMPKFQVAKVMLRSEGLNGHIAGIAFSRKTVVIPILRVPELMQYVKSMNLNTEQRAVAETLSTDLAKVFEAKMGRPPVAATTYASPDEVASATHRKVVHTPQGLVAAAIAPAVVVAKKEVEVVSSTTRRDIIHSLIKAMVRAVPDGRKASTAMKLAKCVPPLDSLSEDNFLDVVVDLALVNQ